MRKLLFQSLIRPPLTERPPEASTAAIDELASALDGAARKRLGRSLSIRMVDAGSCNGCELELHALNNAFYDLERFGLRFVASPRHGDVLLVTGAVTKNMHEALERTYNATPDPQWPSQSAIVRTTAASLQKATPSWAVSAVSCRLICTSAAARLPRLNFSKGCSRCLKSGVAEK